MSSNIYLLFAIIAGTQWIDVIATAKAERSMSGGLFRWREFRGARKMNATTYVDAQWARLSANDTAKFKEICRFDINIGHGRFGLLILPMRKMGND